MIDPNLNLNLNLNSDKLGISSDQTPHGKLPSAALHVPPEIQVIHEGSGEIGTVHLFKQIHEHKCRDPYHTLVQTGKHTAALFSSLLQMENLAAIFSEGLSSEYAASPQCQLDYCKYYEPRLLALFPDRVIPSHPSDEQYFALAASGATFLAKFFMPHVPLKGTYPDESIGVPSLEILQDPVLHRNWVFTHREQMAMREIASFLRQEAPGTHVALVFGRAHNFDTLPEEIVSDRVPRVVAYSFYAPSPSEYTRKIVELCSMDPEGAVKLAHEASKVCSWSWHKLTAEAQSIVLTKLEADLDFCPSPEALLAELIRGINKTNSSESANAALRTRIVALYEQKEGPFADLCLRPNVSSIIAECSTSENFDGAIAVERHPFTQLTMIECALLIDWRIFSSLLSVKAQIHSLDKLYVDSSEPGEVVYRFLLDYARSDAVKAEIQRRCNPVAGPFAPPVAQYVAE